MLTSLMFILVKEVQDIFCMLCYKMYNKDYILISITIISVFIK